MTEPKYVDFRPKWMDKLDDLSLEDIEILSSFPGSCPNADVLNEECKMTQPVSYEEMQARWRKGINVPDKLMEEINALVVRHFDGEQAVFLMSEFTKVVGDFLHSPKDKDLLADVGKEIAFRYRDAGWNVNTISGQHIYCKFSKKESV